MNRKPIIILTTLMLLGSVGVLCGQEPEGFTKQIEIEKEFSAVVSQAERIEIEPRLLDTTIVRPTMKYSILSVAHKSDFRTEQITPVAFSTARWAKPSTYYLNVGAGAPLQSEADFYWTPVQSRGRELVVGVNHEGVDARRIGVDNQGASALRFRNRLGVHYTTPVDSVGRLEADVTYQGVVVNHGGVGLDGVPLTVASNNALAGCVRLVGDMGKGSPLSYVARLSGNYALAGMGGQRNMATNGSMWRYCVDYALGGLDSIKRWLPSRVTLYYYGVRSEGVAPYYDTSVTLIPEWQFRVGKWLPVRIMAGYDYMVYRGAVQSWRGLIGSVDVAWERNPKVVPFVKISNDIDAGLMAPTLWTNPYHNLMPSDSRKVYRAELGAKGALSGVAYEVKGGFVHYSKWFYTKAVEGSPVLLWGADGAGLDMWYAEGVAAWQPLRNLVVRGGVKWNMPRFHSQATTEADHAYSIREVEGSLAAAYQPIEGVNVELSAVAATATTAQMVDVAGTLTSVAMPAYVDVGLKVCYDVKPKLQVWLRGDNLLAQPIYHWATYREMGISGRMGVSLTF